MFYSNDEQEIRKLVTFYTVYTCIYFPVLLLTLLWSEEIYYIGKYKFHSVLIIIIVAEIAKYFASALHFKINDVNLTKKHEDKSVFSIIRSVFGKAKVKEGLKTVLTVAVMISVYFFVSILYGAEISSKHEETLMFSSLLSILTVFPACINIGSHAISSFLFGNKPNDKLETLIYQNLYFTVFGAWLGAFVIPLDWDRPWQEWPIPCSVGAMSGFTVSHVVMIFRISWSSETLPNSIALYKNSCVNFVLRSSSNTLCKMGEKIFYALMLLIFLVVTEAVKKYDTNLMQGYNPCCSMPCLHRGVCTPISNVQYECDCVKGYFGKSCEKATLTTWFYNLFKFSSSAKQKFALTGKLFWGIVNNIPILHDSALRYVYMSANSLERSSNQVWNLAHDYTTLDVYYNRSYSIRSLPPVPCECPTPLGVKGPKYLPNVEDVYHILFQRREFKPCPYGTNIMFATFAEHLSYQFFKTDFPKESGFSFGSEGADVSQIYGSDEATRRALRSMVNGKMKTTVINGEEYPPYLEDVPEVKMYYPPGSKVTPKWAMGHQLFSMTPLMFAMATIWLREHNRVCDVLVKEHPDWSDERIYQTVRWIILGELLTITAGEYIQHLAQYKLKFGYKPHLIHDTPIAFTDQMQYEFNLIFQWHQTMPDVISIQGNNYNLTDLMFSSNRVVFEHGLDAIVDSMSRSPSGQITYRNCGNAVKSFMIKLIQEGRKTRLHSLNDYRRFYDLKPYETFLELIGDPELAESLEDLYGDIDAVEFVVGIFMEKHYGSIVPPTMIFLAGPVALKGIMGNPIGSSALWRPSTFGGKVGFDIVQKATLRKLFCLNLKGNCKNNVWVSFRTPYEVMAASKYKNFMLSRK